MTLRAAREEDVSRIEAFLKQHADTSMFLRSNLAQFGPCGAADDPNAMRVWIGERRYGIEGVLGLTRNGTVLLQWPRITPSVAAAWRAAVGEISGIVGAPDQIDSFAGDLQLERARARLDDTQDLYTLNLLGLRLPPGDTVLRAPRARDAAQLSEWRAAYLTEVLAVPEAEAATQGPADVARLMADDRLRVLADGKGVPLAMTAFNAAVADRVQVGGVYTPPPASGRGLARRAVALHLAEAREGGAARAILFAANEFAARAYVSIGFAPSGTFGFLLFPQPQEIAA